MSAKPLQVGTRVQLFVDDYLITESKGLNEHLHAMTKHPTPVLTAEAPWERPAKGGLAGPVNVTYDPATGLTRLWYNTRGTFTAGILPGEPSLACYATSCDGINFERPDLGLVDYDGSTANNILGDRSRPASSQMPAPAPGSPAARRPGAGWAGPGHGMLYCPEMSRVEPPDMRYKTAHYMGEDQDGLHTYGVWFSPDGLRWRSFEGNPVLRGRDWGDVVSCANLRDTQSRFDAPGFPSAKYALFHKTHVQLGPWRRRCFGVSTAETNYWEPNGDSFEEQERHIGRVRKRYVAHGGGNSRPPFTEWSTPALVLTPDQRDDEMAEERLATAAPVLVYDHPHDHRCEFYGVNVFRCGDLFLGLLWIFDAAFEMSRFGGSNQVATVELQLVCSRDLIHWHRAGQRRTVLGRGEPGSFDSAMIFYHSLPVSVGDEWWIYYAGFDTAHSGRPYFDPHIRARYLDEARAGARRFPAIGLAKVRREGFISLDAGADGGTLVTRPITPGGTRLAVNADMGRNGTLKVEVQEPSGRPLPGFEASACTGLSGDGLRQVVRWGERRGDASWPDRSVRLKFELRDAKLYGFCFTGV